MKLLNNKTTPVLIMTACIAIAFIVTSNPPSAKRGIPKSDKKLMVEVQTLKRSDLAIKIASYGTVKPRTQSVLFPQVSGQIISIGSKFREGGFFEEGEILVEIDNRDYLVEIKIAQAGLFSAQQILSEEQARVEQALQDWERLGNSEQAPDLVLRKPQLMAAQAKVFSAQATLTKAELALERTKIVAPYSGRILHKFVDVGQVVSANTQLAEIYATDYVEIRLPIKNNDLPFMILPESNRFQSENKNEQPAVSIFSDITPKQKWLGRIVRTEGALDAESQQLFVVAHVEDPYGVNINNSMPIKIGQYVGAQIDGKVIKQALVIPNKAIYQGSYIYIVDNNLLQRTAIDIVWQNEQFALIGSGIDENQLLVLTPLGQVNSGTVVEISVKDGQIKASDHKRGLAQ